MGMQLGCLAAHPEGMAHSHTPPPALQSSFVVTLASGSETEAGALGSGWGDIGEAGQGWGHCSVTAPIRDRGVREGVDSWMRPLGSPLCCAWLLGGNLNPVGGPGGQLQGRWDALGQRQVWQE